MAYAHATLIAFRKFPEPISAVETVAEQTDILNLMTAVFVIVIIIVALWVASVFINRFNKPDGQ